MQTHGLINDSVLCGLLERLRDYGKLSGKESIEVEFLSELESSLKIAANLNVKLFKASAKFNMKTKNIHSIKKKLSIEF